MSWADKVRTLKVRTNCRHPEDAVKARSFGAEGIGLCRTEHMFFGDQRIVAMRKMILADDEAGRKAALAELEPFQKQDFIGIFEAMDGLPVTIRLLDPPLHEFLPHDDNASGQARGRPTARHPGRKGTAPGRAASRVEPDARAARLPAADQVSRDRRHAGAGDHRGGDRGPEEGQDRAAGDHDSADRHGRGADVPQEAGGGDRRGDLSRRPAVKVEYPIGTMIEIPRAALTADQIAEEAEFFSFGTNDLTQMTFGFSRDDIGSFMPTYVDQKILPVDPFQTLDISGRGPVGRDRRRARAARLARKSMAST